MIRLGSIELLTEDEQWLSVEDFRTTLNSGSIPTPSERDAASSKQQPEWMTGRKEFSLRSYPCGIRRRSSRPRDEMTHEALKG